jgi:hypothetical protein
MLSVGHVWAAPGTIIGLIAAIPALAGGRMRLVEGVIEVHSPWHRWALAHLVVVPGGVSAITLGHLVLATDADALCQTRAHERVHVRQYERWGPFFIPAYLLASLWALARGGDAYFDNVFEREAYANTEGAHVRRNARPGDCVVQDDRGRARPTGAGRRRPRKSCVL